MAIVVENDPFSLDVHAGVLEDTARFGIEVVVDDALPADLNDMSATLAKVKALSPDILIVSGHERGAALAIRPIE